MAEQTVVDLRRSIVLAEGADPVQVAAAMRAIVTARRDRGAPLTWIQIGSVAGPTAPVPSAALRAARLQIVGSGQGAVPTDDILAELPGLAAVISAGRFRIGACPVSVRDVTAAWRDTGTADRIVITP